MTSRTNPENAASAPTDTAAERPANAAPDIAGRRPAKATRKRPLTKRDWLSNEPGSWAIVLMPALCAWLACGPNPTGLWLVALWALCYCVQYTAARWFKARFRQRRWLTPMLTYVGALCIAGIPFVVLHPGILRLAPIYLLYIFILYIYCPVRRLAARRLPAPRTLTVVRRRRGARLERHGHRGVMVRVLLADSMAVADGVHGHAARSVAARGRGVPAHRDGDRRRVGARAVRLRALRQDDDP